MESLKALDATIDRLDTAFERMKKPQNNASIHIDGSGLIAVAVGIIGAVAIVVAVSAVIIVSIWRDADLRDMSQLRAKQRELDAYSTAHEKRLNELEKKQHVPTR